MRVKRWPAIAAMGMITAFGGAQEVAKPDATMRAHKAGPVSTTLTVTIDGRAKRFTVADLAAMPQQEVSGADTKTGREAVWSGPSLATVLAACGMPFGKDTVHDILHHYAVAAGTDGYVVVFSAGELIEAFSGASHIVAIKRDGLPLGPAGEFALFNNRDKMAARHVSNLTTLEIRAAVR